MYMYTYKHTCTQDILHVSCTLITFSSFPDLLARTVHNCSTSPKFARKLLACAL